MWSTALDEALSEMEKVDRTERSEMLHIRVTPETKRALELYRIDNHCSMTDVINALLDGWRAGVFELEV